MPLTKSIDMLVQERDDCKAEVQYWKNKAERLKVGVVWEKMVELRHTTKAGGIITEAEGGGLGGSWLSPSRITNLVDEHLRYGRLAGHIGEDGKTYRVTVRLEGEDADKGMD